MLKGIKLKLILIIDYVVEPSYFFPERCYNLTIY